VRLFSLFTYLQWGKKCEATGQFFVIPLLFKFTLNLSALRSWGDILVLVFTVITVLAGQVLYVVVETRLTSHFRRFSIGR